MKIIIEILISLSFSSVLLAQNGQTASTDVDKVITLEEVIVYPKGGNIHTLKTSAQRTIRLSIKGACQIVSPFRIKANNRRVQILGVVFYFNYQWGDSDKDGFIIRPIILDAKYSKPNDFVYQGNEYFITKKINYKMYFDLSRYDIQLKGKTPYFIGLNFMETVGKSSFEDFNIALIPDKRHKDQTYVKPMCSTCNFSPLNLNKKQGVVLKYKILYALLKD